MSQEVSKQAATEQLKVIWHLVHNTLFYTNKNATNFDDQTDYFGWHSQIAARVLFALSVCASMICLLCLSY